jgi:hypothetical protein
MNSRVHRRRFYSMKLAGAIMSNFSDLAANADLPMQSVGDMVAATPAEAARMP